MILRIKYIILLMLTLTNFTISQNFWQRISSPTENTLRALHFADSLRGWVGGDSGAIFYTSDGGLNWIQQQTNTLNKIVKLFFLDDNRAWALAWSSLEDTSFYGTEILQTNNGGKTWKGTKLFEEQTYMQAIYFLDSLKGFMGGGMFVETSDGGLTWKNANIDSATFSTYPVYNFNFYNELYGFACGGQWDAAGVIWKTTNGGYSWSTIDVAYTPPDVISDLHFFDSLNVMGIGGDPELLYGIGFLESSDAGNSWKYSEIAIIGRAVSLSFRTENEGWAVVPQTESFVATFDYGINWIEFAAPENSALYDLVFPDSLTGYAVGKGGVIVKYKYQIPDDVDDEFSPEPDDFTLYQNYPNPFNPITTIQYNLSKSGNVTINIFNTLGSHIVTLVDEIRSSGVHNSVWYAKSEPSGVYYIQMKFNGSLSTKKMLLLK